MVGERGERECAGDEDRERGVGEGHFGILAFIPCRTPPQFVSLPL
jgi:hypothetical protein